MPSHSFSFICPSVHPSVSPSVHLIKSSIYPSKPIHLSIQANPSIHPSQSIYPSKPIHLSIQANPSILVSHLSIHLSISLSLVHLSLYPISFFFLFCQSHIHLSPSVSPSPILVSPPKDPPNISHYVSPCSQGPGQFGCIPFSISVHMHT